MRRKVYELEARIIVLGGKYTSKSVSPVHMHAHTDYSQGLEGGGVKLEDKTKVLLWKLKNNQAQSTFDMIFFSLLF